MDPSVNTEDRARVALPEDIASRPQVSNLPAGQPASSGIKTSESQSAAPPPAVSEDKDTKSPDEATPAKQSSGNVKLDTGEYVSREAYDQLPDVDQEFLKTVGIAKFNEVMNERQRVLSIPVIKILMPPPSAGSPRGEMINVKGTVISRLATKEELADFYKNNVEVWHGRYVPKADYEKLSPEDQAKLKRIGVNEFNRQVQANVAKVTAGLNKYEIWEDGARKWLGRAPDASKYVKVGPEESNQYISKALFDTMRSDEQKHTMQTGISTWGYETGGTVPEDSNAHDEARTNAEASAAIDSQDSAREQELRDALGAAQNHVPVEGEDTAAYEASIKDIAAKVAAIDAAKQTGEMSEETRAAIYGKAAPYVNMAEGTVDLQGALKAGIPDADIRSLGISQMEIVNTRQAMRQQKKWEDVNRQVSDFYAAKQAEFEQNNVRLADGKYISKQDLANIETANPRYAEIARSQGFDAMLAEINKDLGDVKPPPTAAEIRSAQEAYFQKKSWDFQDKTNSKYAERLLEATRDYSDSKGYTVPQSQIAAETRAQRTGTLKESVVQLVPFEYLRSNRWGTLATWEKIVYPIMDVATVIPVVGWAGKGASAAIKAGSTGAKIAALGGKEAVDLALKDATAGLEKAAVGSLDKQIFRKTVENSLKAAIEAGSKSKIEILRGVFKAATKDATLAQKELTQIRENVTTLQKLAAAAAKTEAKTAGTKAFAAASKIARVGEETAKVGRLKTTVAKAADIAGAGIGSAVVSQATIRNWNELSPAQRVAGIGMAALTLGIVSPTIKGAINTGENVANPFKIPKSAAATRRTNSIQRVGEIWAEEGGKTGGTTRLVVDEALGPEKAREAMAKALREQHATGGDVVLDYGEHQPVMKGTGFQGIAGGNISFSATPMGDIFQKGTGASGKKTLLEQSLERINKKLPVAERIEIEAKPYDLKTVSTPGVTVAGKEGGMYVGQTAYTKFSNQSAFGAKGKMPSIIMISDTGISSLPKRLSAMDIKDMEIAAKKLFDGAHNVGETVEGIKQYKRFIEAENVITNGTQLQRVQNFRSRLADALKQNKAEYFTRTEEGQREILGMYVEGGRAVPLTLKKVYALKGRALRNALEDLVHGLDEKLKALKQAPKQTATITVIDEPKLNSALRKAAKAGVETSEVQKLATSGDIDGALGKFDEVAKGKAGRLTAAETERIRAEIAKSRKTTKIRSPEEHDLITKEEQINDQFMKLDKAQRAGRITAEEAAEAKRAVVERYRYASIPPTRAATVERVIGQRFARTAAQNLSARAGERAPDTERTAGRVEERTLRSEARQGISERGEPVRLERAIQGPRQEPLRTSEPRVPEQPRPGEEPRPAGPLRNEPPRTEEPPRGSEPPRVDQAPRTNAPPRIGTPRIDEIPREPRRPPRREPPQRTPTLSHERPTQSQLRNADAWPQGMGWWLVWEGKDGQLYRRFYYGDRPPAGIKNVPQGPGEARRGIQRFRGKNGRIYEMPMGVVSTQVNAPGSSPGRAGAIDFSPSGRSQLPPLRSKLSRRSSRITPGRASLPKRGSLPR